jgi:hypothetical protein
VLGEGMLNSLSPGRDWKQKAYSKLAEFAFGYVRWRDAVVVKIMRFFRPFQPPIPHNSKISHTCQSTANCLKQDYTGYEKVESFKCLGAMITCLNDIETEIKIKIAVGNKCCYALGTILKRRSIS